MWGQKGARAVLVVTELRQRRLPFVDGWRLDPWMVETCWNTSEAAGSSAGRRDACAGISIWHISLMFLNFYQKLPWSEGTTKHVVGVVWKSLTIILSLHLVYIALVVLLFCDACNPFRKDSFHRQYCEAQICGKKRSSRRSGKWHSTSNHSLDMTWLRWWLQTWFQWVRSSEGEQ